MNARDDVDVAALVVALMTPFEDRIAALENDLTALRNEVSSCVSLEEFEELKRHVDAVVTKQKAAAVMTSHTMHELGSLNTAVRAQAAIAQPSPLLTPRSPPHTPVTSAKKVVSEKGKGKVFRSRTVDEPQKGLVEPSQPPESTGSAFMFNFGGNDSEDTAEASSTVGPVTDETSIEPSPAIAICPGESSSNTAADHRGSAAPVVVPALQGKQEAADAAALKEEKARAKAKAKQDKERERREEEAKEREREQERAREREEKEKEREAKKSQKALDREAKKRERELAREKADAEEEAAMAEAKARLNDELAWCIAQLDAGLLQTEDGEEPDPEQVRESEKVKKTLLSSKVPLVRKRHTMKLVFGDYRTLMKELTVPEEFLDAARQALEKAVARGC